MKIGDMGVRVMPAGYEVVSTHNYDFSDRMHMMQRQNFKTRMMNDSTKHVMHNRNHTGKGHGRHS